MRAHTQAEAERVIDLVHDWQHVYFDTLGRPLVFASDEYYLLADRPFPAAQTYGEFNMYEDGVGMARLFELEFTGQRVDGTGPQSGFFASVDGAPADGYRAPRVVSGTTTTLALRPRASAPIGVLTSVYGARIIGPHVASLGRPNVRVIAVENQYFGGTTSVTGLLTGADLQRTLYAEPEGHRYLLPDVCLSQGRFLDGLTPEDLPRPVEIVPTDGVALRRALLQGTSS